jgi:hypothetical protein
MEFPQLFNKLMVENKNLQTEKIMFWLSPRLSRTSLGSKKAIYQPLSKGNSNIPL